MTTDIRTTQPRRIAVVGAGIAGMGAALALSERHDVTLFEGSDRAGGHADTATIEYPMAGGPRPVSVDTGFIVYNAKTYPNLTALLAHLEAPTKWSDMSLGFSIDGGAVEWAGDNLNKIFGQRRNLVRPRFIRMAREVLRFNREAEAALQAGGQDEPIGAWLDARGFDETFRRWYLYPMAGAIWSTRSGDVAGFPALALFAFYRNHELFAGLGDAVQWRTVDGGSRAYVSKVEERLGARLVKGRAVERVDPGPVLRFADGTSEAFDEVVLATHSDEALALLPSADREVGSLLGDVRYAPNEAWLHRDARLMPKRRRVWSSWNAMTGGDAERDGASVTYWMNRLQGIDRAMPLFVSLNPAEPPRQDTVFKVASYAHPQFDSAAFAAQAGMDAVQGRGGVWFAGAWLGYGFHEDGLRSGLRVAEALGARPDWARDTGMPLADARSAEAA